MNKQLQYLIELQHIDQKINEYRKSQDQIPSAIDALRNNFNAAKEMASSIEEDIENMKKILRSDEGKIDSIVDSIGKKKEKLFEIKTNKEYTAMLNEIKQLEGQKEEIENGMLEKMETLENSKSIIAEKKKELETEEQNFFNAKREKEDELREIQQKLTEEEDLREKIASSIDRSYLTTYERISRLRGGIAVAEVKDVTCQGCFMTMPLQKFSDVKKNEKLITCTYCSRILYWKETPEG